MEQINDILLKYLSESKSIVTKDSGYYSGYDWWAKNITVSGISDDKHLYLYCIDKNNDDGEGVFYLDYDFMKSHIGFNRGISHMTIQSTVCTILGENFNFGNIKALLSNLNI